MIKDYLARKHILEQTPGILKNGQLFAIYKGELIPDKIFRKMFELPVYVYGKKENPCKKGEWIV